MTKSHIQNGVALDYYNLQENKETEQPHQLETSVTNILFDESHDELLRSKPSTDNQLSTWAFLRELLESQLHCTIELHSEDAGIITSDILEKFDVLVLAAPRKSLEKQEIEAIAEFVTMGKSLLVAGDRHSLLSHQQHSSNSLNGLLEHFGVRLKQLFQIPSLEVSKFTPHYLSSEINLLFLKDPAYLDITRQLSRPPEIVARLPETDAPCLVALDSEDGRVVTLSDVAILGDEYIDYGNNRHLALNIFQWLTVQNQLDCFDAHIKPEIECGKVATFSISLSNPHDTRLEYVSCLLEANSSVQFLDAQEQSIRSIAPYGQVRLQWTIRPTELGDQQLKLTIDSLKAPKLVPLFFDSVAQFTCTPDVDIDLIILNQQGEIPEVLETGQSVEVKAVFRQKIETVSQKNIDLHLVSSSKQLLIEPIGQPEGHYWRLTAQKTGECPITLLVNQTGQRISRLIKICPSASEQINSINKNIVASLEDEIQRCITSLKCVLNTPEILSIPVQLCTPEQYLQLLYSEEKELVEQLTEALRVARRELCENPSLVKLLLQFIAPAFSPIHGCCIPFDPALATHLAKRHRRYEDYLAQNFLTLESYDSTYLKQNIAALILHEKYGHGFFFSQTTLGRQLAILSKHGMDGDSSPKHLRSPYPRKLYESHRVAIRRLWQEAEILIEGFATWVELSVLPLLSDPLKQSVYRRKSFLFNDADGRYQKGYEYFCAIQSCFDDSGINAVMQAMVKAADIDVGISEEGGKVHFALDAKMLEMALTDDPSSTSADFRLEQIYNEHCNS